MEQERTDTLEQCSVAPSRKRVARAFGWIALALVLVFGSLIPGYKYFVSKSFISIDLASEAGGRFKVYWAKGGTGAFAEDRHASIRIPGGLQRINLILPDIGQNVDLRIDPFESMGTAWISRIEFSGRSWRIPVMEDGAFTEGVEWRVGGTVETHAVGPEGLSIVSDGVDPHLILTRLPAGDKIEQPQIVEGLAVLAIFSIPIWWRWGRRSQKIDWSLLPVLVLALVFGLLVVIAFYSHRSAHPDEEVHLKAAHYYQTNWAMPSIDDPRIAGSFSTYGYSRLNGSEIVYFVAGKFGEILSPLQIRDEHVKFRLFNLLLYLILLLLAVRDRQFRLILIPVSAFPQAWYLFAYFNSDGFALFLCLLLAYHAVAKDGLLSKENIQVRLKGVLSWTTLILMGGCMAMVKPNFWPFSGFFIGYLLVRDFPSKATFLKAGVLILSAISFYSVWMILANAQNDWRHKERIVEKAAAIASARFNVAGDLATMSPGLLLRERGVSLATMLTEWRWFYRTYCTSIGSFGWLNKNPQPRHYDILKTSYLIAGLVVLTQLFMVPGWRGRLIVLGGLFSIFALFTASIFHSWTSDFQAQGRYLSAVLPILGIMIYESRRKSFLPLIHASLVLIWMAGFCVVLTIALGQTVGLR
ncbi:MAG: hypothetical protein ACFCU4_06690 [Puniceicoccaceae bacterium]